MRRLTIVAIGVAAFVGWVNAVALANEVNTLEEERKVERDMVETIRSAHLEIRDSIAAAVELHKGQGSPSYGSGLEEALAIVDGVQVAPILRAVRS